MNPKQFQLVLEKAVANPVKTPPIMVWGPPGIGKSAIPKQVAHNKEIGWVDLRGPLLDPTDMRGFPMVIENEARWIPPSFLPKEGSGILFLDELASSPPLVQAGMYQLVLDRAIGEYQLPDGWFILAAGNRLEDRAVSYRMPTALANRFSHIELTVSTDDWCNWAMMNRINPNIISFIRFKPDMLWAFNPQSSEKAFASPRTWEFAHRMIQVTPTKLLSEMLEGTIGRGATAEFLSFLKVQTELPNLDDILNKGVDYVPPKGRMDLRYALISALVTRAKNTAQFSRLIDYSATMETEFAVLMMVMLIGKDQGTLALCPNWAKWAKKHYDLIPDISDWH